MPEMAPDTNTADAHGVTMNTLGEAPCRQGVARPCCTGVELGAGAQTTRGSYQQRAALSPLSDGPVRVPDSRTACHGWRGLTCHTGAGERLGPSAA